LRIERIAGKDFTTLDDIKKMRELCRVQAKEHAYSSDVLDTVVENSSPKRFGLSKTVANIEPPRDCRRPFGLSYAAMAGCSSMA
jgi:hypothetical protein